MQSLVPTNATVLSQFNMPQFSDRYYFTYPGQYDPSYPIDYAINDPENSYWFTTPVRDTGPDFYNFNMFELSNTFLENSSYGIYGQSMGALLFKLNYTGPPIYYKPLNFNLTFQNSESGSTKIILLYPGTFDIRLASDINSNVTLYLGSSKVFTFTNETQSTSLFIPLYSYSSLTLSGDIRGATISFSQIGPAKEVNGFPMLSSLKMFQTFSANNSFFSPTNAILENFNNKTFSLEFCVNFIHHHEFNVFYRRD